MQLFGRKKEEVKKELSDIQQIKESISASSTPSTPVHDMAMPEKPESQETQAAASTEDWMKEFGDDKNFEQTPEQTEQTEVPENPKEWISQQVKIPPMPSPVTEGVPMGSLPAPMPGPIPRVQMLQTPDMPMPMQPMRRKNIAALVHKSPMSSIPESAPLFIKLDRYKNILSAISDLRSTVSKVRNAVEMFGEMERVKAENLRVIEAVMQKVEARTVDLESEFTKPVENLRMGKDWNEGKEKFQDESWQPIQQQEGDNLHKMIQDLHGQIGRLKEELDQMGVSDKKAVEEFDD